MCALFISMNNVVYEIQIGPYRQIGSTNSLERRMSEHLNSLEKEKHVNRLMQNVYNKYRSFSYKILQSFETREEAYFYEQELLNEYFCKPGYLMMSNYATGYMSGESHPNKKDEARKKQSKRLTLNNPMKDPRVQKKKAEANRKKWQEDPKDISYLYTEEVCKKRRESLKKYYKENPKNQTGSNNSNAKKILNVETGEIYNTGKEAAIALGFKSAWISALARKGIKLRFI